MKKILKILFSLIVVLVFFNGCGGSSIDNKDSNTTQTSQGELEIPPNIPTLN